MVKNSEATIVLHLLQLLRTQALHQASSRFPLLPHAGLEDTASGMLLLLSGLLLLQDSHDLVLVGLQQFTQALDFLRRRLGHLTHRLPKLIPARSLLFFCFVTAPIWHLLLLHWLSTSRLLLSLDSVVRRTGFQSRLWSRSLRRKVLQARIQGTQRSHHRSQVCQGILLLNCRLWLNWANGLRRSRTGGLRKSRAGGLRSNRTRRLNSRGLRRSHWLSGAQACRR